jgi:RecB family endonuclease NucS
LFKIDEDKKTMTIGEQELSEKELEDLVEKNPAIIPDTELLLIRRQVPTDYGAIIDLLGINATGNTVIVERDEANRWSKFRFRIRKGFTHKSNTKRM